MPNYTTNYNLQKPIEETEFVDIDVINSNMDILDTTIKTISDESVKKSLATATNDFLVGATGGGSWIKKTLTEVKAIFGLGSAAYTESSAYATAAQGIKADGALPASSYTAADVKAKLITVDGSGSTIDADMVDGKHANNTANNLIVSDSNGKVPIANLPTGTTSTTVSAGNHTHSGTYEPVDSDIMRKDVDQTMTANLVANVGSDYTTKRARNIVYKTGADFTTTELGLGDLGCVY